MLSDACLERSRVNARFKMGVKHRSFIAEAGTILPLDFAPLKYYILPVDKRTGKRYSGWKLSSRSDQFLTQQHDRWYRNRIKIVPKNIKLTPTCLLWWYLGDGHLERKTNRPNYRRVVLCTDSFTLAEINCLIHKLKKLLNSNDSIYEEGRHIIIGRMALCRFIKTIGSKSPVSDYDYKFEFGQYVDEDYFKKSFAVRTSVADFGDRMKQANSKSVICIETGKQYPSATVAAKDMKCCVSTIATAAKKGKAALGYHWEYLKGLK